MVVRRTKLKGAGNTQRIVTGWYLFGFIPVYLTVSMSRQDQEKARI